MKISSKMRKEIEAAIKIGLDDVKEFEELERRELFESPPKFWTEIEEAICDYTMRKEYEIREAVFAVLEGKSVQKSLPKSLPNQPKTTEPA